MGSFILAADTFEVRTLIIGLLVAAVVGLIAYAICVALNHAGVPAPAALVALIAFLLVLLLYALDAFD